jgi:3',5'-cyclic AMP phosphodiesterase CpdA
MTTLHFAQISDIHISSRSDHLEMLSGHSADFLADVLARLNQVHNLDFVLITGDLFDLTDQEEVTRFQRVIGTLQQPYYIIPGNHDRCDSGRDDGLTRHQFARLFNPQVEARPREPEAQAGYWSVTVHPEFQLIGLDSVRDEDWGGVIDSVQLEWLRAEFAAHADKLIILAVHHPFHALAPIDEHPDWGRFVCDNGPEMLALLDDHPQVKVVLTGHHHLAKAETFGQRLHLACPALASYPCAYRTLRLSHQTEWGWQIEWQTHFVADEATITDARQRMVSRWMSEGFEPEFAEEYARLALGSQTDRNGKARLSGV